MARSRTLIFLSLTLFSILGHGATSFKAYENLQDLKLSVKSAYMFSLIVDADARAHLKRNARLAEIERSAKDIADITELNTSQHQELKTRIHVYLRSAKGEAATYDVNLGSRTASNGYVAYSELIEQIDASMQSIKQQSPIPLKYLATTKLVNNIVTSIEIHSERALKTLRAEQFSQDVLAKVCSNVQTGIAGLSKFEASNVVMKKTNLKWSFIKTPACVQDKTNAPFSVIYYGELMVKELQAFATVD